MESVATRRGVLSGFGVAGAAAGLAAMPAVAEAAQPSVRGTWLIKPTAGGGPAGFQALAAFAAGGVFVTTGSDEPGTRPGEWSGGSKSPGLTLPDFPFDYGGQVADTLERAAQGGVNGSELSGAEGPSPLVP